MDAIEYFRFLGSVISRRSVLTDRARSIYDIDYDKLRMQGVRLLIFDADDTLTGNKDRIPERSARLLARLKKRFRVAVHSNCSPKRHADLTRSLDVYVQKDARKPGKEGFVSLLEHFSVRPQRAAMIGDRIGTDLWGAFVCGIGHRILVTPYSDIFPARRPNPLFRLLRKVEFYMQASRPEI